MQDEFEQQLFQKAVIPHSLGKLERLCLQLARGGKKHLSRPHLVVFAGDHGITKEGVSHSTKAVTVQMATAFSHGQGACGLFCRELGVGLSVVDMGMDVPRTPPGIQDLSVARGTRDFLHEGAMTPRQCGLAIARGRSVVRDLDADCLLVGEMGVGNSTSAATMLARLLHLPPESVVSAGSGASEDDLLHKREVVAASLRRDPVTEPEGVLCAFGGFEIAGMVGAMLEAGERRIPLVLDGMITLAAALCAKGLGCDTSLWIAGHRSSALGCGQALDALGLEPVMEMGMRLGEGTGALCAWPMVRLASVLWDLGSFSALGVDDSTRTLQALGIV